MLNNMERDYLIVGYHYCLHFSDKAAETQKGKCLPKVTQLSPEWPFIIRAIRLLRSDWDLNVEVVGLCSGKFLLVGRENILRLI